MSRKNQIIFFVLALFAAPLFIYAQISPGPLVVMDGFLQRIDQNTLMQYPEDLIGGFPPCAIFDPTQKNYVDCHQFLQLGPLQNNYQAYKYDITVRLDSNLIDQYGDPFGSKVLVQACLVSSIYYDPIEDKITIQGMDSSCNMLYERHIFPDESPEYRYLNFVAPLDETHSSIKAHTLWIFQSVHGMTFSSEFAMTARRVSIESFSLVDSKFGSPLCWDVKNSYDVKLKYPSGAVSDVSVDECVAAEMVGTYTLSATGPSGDPTPITVESNVDVDFTIPAYNLSVTTAGPGTITSNPVGINCGFACSYEYAHNMEVILSAVPNPDSSFSGWGGDCSGFGTCTISMTKNRNVVANFNGPPFDYTLRNSGQSTVAKVSGDAHTTNVITRALASGAPSPISLSLSGVPDGVSYVISNSSCAPSPECDSVVTFTVAPTAPNGTHPITVIGSPLGKETTFNLVISGNPIIVSCTASPSLALIGESVTWTATVVGGTGPFTYLWSGTGVPSPAPTSSSFVTTYSTIGQKTATVTVTDSEAVSQGCNAASIQVNFQPQLQEV